MGVIRRENDQQARKEHVIARCRYAGQVDPDRPSCSRNTRPQQKDATGAATIPLARRTWKKERQVATCVQGVDQIDSFLIDGDNAFNHLRMAEL